MDVEDSPEERVFRNEVQAWLDGTVPEAYRTQSWASDLIDVGTSDFADACRSWQRLLFDGGYAGLTWPSEFGGRGASIGQQLILSQELGRYSLPIGLFLVAVGMVGPTLIVHGTTEQQEAHLRPILTGEEVWCQLFSEPGAGSDLTSLQTRAQRDGDEYVVNGQKVWTSFAQHSDWAILLARTGGPGTGRHGITSFFCDMRTPGIEVRPLCQMTGVAHFNEVFLTDVRIPVANVVGEVDEGWTVARTTLTSERMTIGGTGNLGSMVDALVDTAGLHGRQEDPIVRQGLARAYTNARLAEFLGLRVQTELSHGRMPGPEASILKLLMSRQLQLIGDLGVSIEGPAGALWTTEDGAQSVWPRRLCDQFMVRIGGGTDEVQRNIVAERILRLPREPVVR
ncbi:MAG: acyl-CoA dehydrogenase family protein [Acidimicrobiales bacterium]